MFTRYSSRSFLDSLLPNNKQLLFLQVLENATPFLRVSFLVKNLEQALPLISMSHQTYLLFKLFTITAGSVFGLIICFLLLSHLPFLILILILISACSAGFLLTELIVLDALQYRAFCLKRDIPVLIDLLYITVCSAGYTHFSLAIRHASKGVGGVIKDELDSIFSKEQFLNQDEILTQIEIRLNDTLITDLIATVKIVQQYGGSLEEKLAQLSSDASFTKLQRAKELANKASGALLAPLLFFHLPVLLLVFLIPAVLAFTAEI